MNHLDFKTTALEDFDFKWYYSNYSLLKLEILTIFYFIIKFILSNYIHKICKKNKKGCAYKKRAFMSGLILVTRNLL